MKIKITNKLNFPRMLQYYRTNKFTILHPKASIEFEISDNEDEVAYFQKLSSKNFEVVFTSDAEKKSEKKKKVEEVVPEEKVEKDIPEVVEVVEETPTDPYAEYSDEDIKNAIKKLGVDTRVKSRIKLIEVLEKNLPEGKTIKDI